MSAMELLNWSRGPALQVALGIFILGMIVRLLEILLLGRKRDLAKARANGMLPGLTTVVSRSVPPKGMWSHLVAGYIWHVGFLLILVFFEPHMLLFRDAFHLSWPVFPNSIVDVITIVSLAALAFTLFVRIADPVRRMLSNLNDYFSWLVTLLPLLTGYLAFHRLGTDYTMMLAIHILSVNLLLIVFPFTKLTHAMTTFLARWYNGATAGRKGVRA